MAMSTMEMLELFDKQASRGEKGLSVAEKTSNYQLAAMNCRQIFKCRLMQGLIAWRLGDDPSSHLSSAVEGHQRGVSVMRSIQPESVVGDTSSSRVGFVASLVGIDFSPSDFDNANADVLLDCVLGKALNGEWDEENWDKGMRELRDSGSALAVDTYSLYRQLFTSESADFQALVEEGGRLFDLRKSDAFFSGGDQTDGGGSDNAITVDYRLAALCKNRRVASESIHLWRW